MKFSCFIKLSNHYILHNNLAIKLEVPSEFIDGNLSQVLYKNVIATLSCLYGNLVRCSILFSMKAEDFYPTLL